MRKELDEALCRDFPKLFSNRHGDVMETAMCWGFECGDGWEKIIRQAASMLELLNNKWQLPKEEWIRASQIKEKFGTLRFYVDCPVGEAADIAFAVADQAERRSEGICEECGEWGRLRGRGWFYTACDKHSREEDRGEEE